MKVWARLSGGQAEFLDRVREIGRMDTRSQALRFIVETYCAATEGGKNFRIGIIHAEEKG